MSLIRHNLLRMIRLPQNASQTAHNHPTDDYNLLSEIEPTAQRAEALAGSRWFGWTLCRDLRALLYLLQQDRTLHVVHFAIFFVALRDIEELIAILSAHERDSLCQLVQVFHQNGVVERGDKVGEIVRIGSQVSDC